MKKNPCRYPKHGRRSNVIPLLKKLEASNQIIDVTAVWFKRWVGLLHLQTRDFAFKDAALHLLQFKDHTKQALGSYKRSGKPS